MNKPTCRVYRRYRRKLACGYCSARHIRCRTPEPSTDADGNLSVESSCQACEAANEECDRGSTSDMRGEHSKLPQRCGKPSKPPQTQQDVPRRTKPNAKSKAIPHQRSKQVANRQNFSCDHSDESEGISDFMTGFEHVEKIQKRSDTTLLDIAAISKRCNDAHTKDSKQKVLYFGNDSVWSHSIRNVCRERLAPSCNLRTPNVLHFSPNVHHSVPSNLDQNVYDMPTNNFDHRSEEVGFLQKKGAFILPAADVQRALLNAYFRWVYPVQRIIDREQFWQEFESGHSSPLLLQSLFLVATTCCDEDIIASNWDSRQTAQAIFFARAKALYDADYEQNRITTIQSLFLMSFWWSSPMDQKDCSHWLGSAIRFAQANGMHRSTKNSNMPTVERKLWKRIWWALYVRDRYDSASIGRPMQIHDDDCDVERLQEEDFVEKASQPNAGTRLNVLSARHSIATAELSILQVGEIIKPVPKALDRASRENQINQKLCQWQTSLAKDLQYHEDESDPETKLFAAMLCLSFCLCKILLSRHMFLQNDPRQEDCQAVSSSANTITRVVEDLISNELHRRAHVHVIPSLFACLTVQITLLRHTVGARKRVLLHKTQVCLLGLAEFEKSWPFAGWMYGLFQSLLKRLQEEGSETDHCASISNNDNGLQRSSDRPVATNPDVQEPTWDVETLLTSSTEGINTSPSEGPHENLPPKSLGEMDVTSLDGLLSHFEDVEFSNWAQQTRNLDAENWTWPLPPVSLPDHNMFDIQITQ